MSNIHASPTIKNYVCRLWQIRMTETIKIYTGANVVHPGLHRVSCNWPIKFLRPLNVVFLFSFSINIEVIWVGFALCYSLVFEMSILKLCWNYVLLFLMQPSVQFFVDEEITWFCLTISVLILSAKESSIYYTKSNDLLHCSDTIKQLVLYNNTECYCSSEYILHTCTVGMFCPYTWQFVLTQLAGDILL